MKASRWSVSAPSGEMPASVTVTTTRALVAITLRQRLPSGQSARMRILMSPEEARELAASLTTPEPRVIPKV